MKNILLLSSLCLLPLLTSAVPAPAPKPQHVVLVMTDDQGWGQTSYNNHPILKTPHLDAMAANGLRFDRFYAGAPVCSPTRASVLTGRCNDRTGVPSHGHPLRLQERTLPRAMQQAGFATGHFGKWHLNGVRGPGVPLFANDSHHPGAFGFDEWLTVSNFFDTDPLMSRKGVFEEFTGDSSEIIVAEALKFITEKVKAGLPTFSVIWYGSPHNPFWASEEDKAPFAALTGQAPEHYGELVAMDRSVGSLRSGLRELGIADDTLIWFNSDNGGLPKITPPTVGGLRANKGSVYEGGLRVPGIIEWPRGIPESRITAYPAATMDIFPTVASLLGLPNSVLLQPSDGISLAPLFTQEIGPRKQPIPFRFANKGALVDNDYKLVCTSRSKPSYELYDLKNDAAETKDLADAQPERLSRMVKQFEQFSQSIDDSVAGKDYPNGKVNSEGEPGSRFWTEIEAYQPYFPEWKNRKEYASRLTPKKPKVKKKKKKEPNGSR